MTSNSLWGKIKRYFQPALETVIPELSKKIRLSGTAIRIPIHGYPEFRIEMGKQELILAPDPGFGASRGESPCDFLLFDSGRYISQIGHFERLAPGKTLILESSAHNQKYVFSSPRDVFRRQFSIKHTGDSLIFKDPVLELGTYVTLTGVGEGNLRVDTRRKAALQRIREIYGGPLVPLPPEMAIETIKEVNDFLRGASGHPKDAEGNPGGIIELPDSVTPILVGDLHASVDNLLTVLSENAFLDNLENGTAALVILGDAVHEEDSERLKEMGSSLLMMDLIFKLKLRFPDNVHYLIGNHDSFFDEVMKRGIPQGLLWDKHVVSVRGEDYRSEMQLFYRLAPLLALSVHFLACHAGPPRKSVSRQMLVDIRKYPDVVHDMTWNRVRTTAFPAGYTSSDVRQFRKSLELESDTPFMVGHNMCSSEGTLWLNVGDIKRHHVVISSRSDKVGLFTCVDGKMIPQIYQSASLVQWLNEQPPIG
ncbi:MAG: hypothetical protein CMQ19_04075 [Gammaproteobacteria bacterium]|nr:hypothetical protein [Gammaproteobacteria bacterium]